MRAPAAGDWAPFAPRPISASPCTINSVTTMMTRRARIARPLRFKRQQLFIRFCPPDSPVTRPQQTKEIEILWTQIQGKSLTRHAWKATIKIDKGQVTAPCCGGDTPEAAH